MKLKILVRLSLIALVAFLVPTANAQTFSVIYSFQAGNSDGAAPEAGVTIRGNALYGTTIAGGLGCGMGHTCGTVYQIIHIGSQWHESLLYRFPPSGYVGYLPQSRVVFGPDGHLYGTTPYGGSSGNGVVFELTPPLSICPTVACFWTEKVLHNFTGKPDDGAAPLYGDLIWDKQGNIYGTAANGGNAWGTVFQMTKSGNDWTEAPIYKFKLSNDGYYPQNGVVMDSNGNLFGTTFFDWTNADGTVFELSNIPQVGWQETILYTFQNNGDGIQPVAGVIMDSSGNLYGVTRSGNNEQGPAVFELSPSGNTWTFKVLYEFPPTWQGPYGSPTLDGAGNLYATMYSGGAYNYGTVFKLTNTANGWVYTSLHDFTGGADGANPISNVSIDTDGTLYGTASNAGLGGGTVWMIKP